MLIISLKKLKLIFNKNKLAPPTILTIKRRPMNILQIRRKFYRFIDETL